ncbi:RNA-binding S4 domain-containing protein [Alkaliphilus oremlandii]|uniref:RNA-binding S4 domain protein n=1 Tax=Alkaliphilus oremlandii (strain OhILAs) TaxID=350688 RepID=A8MEA2_ALKOO|nr:RNA-binding S4 domain-containing protein [Alkaliphilus oremlandii]ABW17573.1 RNA-binding S4 domain protein [Alkaliphilus oremlandii OhILAs]
MRKKVEVKIEGEYIKLDQLLKLAEVVGSGGHAKLVILNGEVKVNEQTIVQRGKKIRVGDKVLFQDIEIEVK